MSTGPVGQWRYLRRRGLRVGAVAPAALGEPNVLFVIVLVILLLIILGLMLATTFISAALAVGDTISTAVRSVAVFNYGRVDEIVSGGHGDLGLFPQGISYRIEQHLAGDAGTRTSLLFADSGWFYGRCG